MSVSVQHNTKDQVFFATADGNEAELAYTRPTDEVIDFTHTYVDEDLRGQGMGEALAHEGLAYARQHQLRVRTSCEFMEAYVQKHRAEYQDLIDS